MNKIIQAYQLHIGKSVTRIIIGFLISSIIGIFVYINSTLQPEINLKFEKLKNYINESNDNFENKYIYAEKENKIIENITQRYVVRRKIILQYKQKKVKLDSLKFYDNKLNSNNTQIIEDKGILLLIAEKYDAKKINILEQILDLELGLTNDLRKFLGGSLKRNLSTDKKIDDLTDKITMFISYSQNDITFEEYIKKDEEQSKIRHEKYEDAFSEIDSTLSKKIYLMYLNLFLFVCLIIFIYLGLIVGHFKD